MNEEISKKTKKLSIYELISTSLLLAIFVTDMKQFALQGYKVGALDYFVKPATYYDLKMRMDKIVLGKKLKSPPIMIHIPGDCDKKLFF